MELKDFIKNVIVEISHGVLKAKKELEDTDYKNTINRIKFSVPISLPTSATPDGITCKILWSD